MKPAQFEQFYEEFFERIYKFVFYRVGGNKELAKDLTQDVFLKAFEAFHRYDPAQSRSAWIYTIARNHIINNFAKSRPGVDLTEIEDSLIASHDPLQVYLLQQEEEGLYKALMRLSSEDRKLVQMKYLEGWSFAELAQIFAKTAPTLRVQASRALKKMQTLLTTLSL